LKPEYNILEQAGSSLGFKHSEETLEFFKNNRKVSEETRKNLSVAATGRILTGAPRPLGPHLDGDGQGQGLKKRKYLIHVKVLSFQMKHVLEYQLRQQY